MPASGKNTPPGSGKFRTVSAPVMEMAKWPVRDLPKAVVSPQKLPLVPASWQVLPYTANAKVNVPGPNMSWKKMSSHFPVAGLVPVRRTRRSG